MSRKQYVYTVTMHYDAWDHYRIGLAATLPVAKRLAQADYDERETDEPTKLHWQPLTGEYTKRPYWIAPVSAYGKEYQINKDEVIAS